MNLHVDWKALARRTGLSDRELAVVRLTLEGARQVDIAAALGLALGTVKTYNRRAYRKVGVHNQRELAIAVMRLVTHLAGAGRLASTVHADGPDTAQP